MGKYFLMSKRFDKIKAEDFGLVCLNNALAVKPDDGTYWSRSNLYDYGWGKEIGYFRLPKLEFEALCNVVLFEKNEEDILGAVTQVLEYHPDELLLKCEQLIKFGEDMAFNRFIDLFDLKNPVNRSNIVGKNLEQIRLDFERWKRIADIARSR